MAGRVREKAGHVDDRLASGCPEERATGGPERRRPDPPPDVTLSAKVRSDGGAAYGETAPGKEPAATAMGLLCRQYLKVKRTEPAYLRGIAFLGGRGPSKTDLAHDYFTTCVLHNYGGASGILGTAAIASC